MEIARIRHTQKPIEGPLPLKKLSIPIANENSEDGGEKLPGPLAPVKGKGS